VERTPKTRVVKEPGSRAGSKEPAEVRSGKYVRSGSEAGMFRKIFLAASFMAFSITEASTALEVFEGLVSYLTGFSVTEDRLNGKQILNLPIDLLCNIYGTPQGFLIHTFLHPAAGVQTTLHLPSPVVKTQVDDNLDLNDLLAGPMIQSQLQGSLSS
jgi:hypothetical protein